MVQNNLARLQKSFTVMPYCTHVIVDIRWASMPTIRRARLSICAVRSFENAELDSLTRLQIGTPGEP